MAGRYFATRPTLADGVAINEVAVDNKGRMIVSGSTDGIAQNVALTTLIAGEDLANDVLATQIKPVVTSSFSPSLAQAVLNDVDIAVKATPGNLLAFRVTSINAGLRYLQIHNKATAPSGGDVPLLSFVIPAGTATVPASLLIGRDIFGSNGLYLSTGISVGVSTTASTFTAATTTDHITTVAYV